MRTLFDLICAKMLDEKRRAAAAPAVETRETTGTQDSASVKEHLQEAFR